MRTLHYLKLNISPTVFVDPKFFLRSNVGHALKRDVISFRQVARQIRRTTSNPRSSQDQRETYPENFTGWTYPNSLSIKEVTRISCLEKNSGSPEVKFRFWGSGPRTMTPSHMSLGHIVGTVERYPTA